MHFDNYIPLYHYFQGDPKKKRTQMHTMCKLGVPRGKIIFLKQNALYIAGERK